MIQLFLIGKLKKFSTFQFQQSLSMFSDHINVKTWCIISKIGCQGKTMECIHILFTILTVKNTWILLVSSFLAIAAGMVEFLLGQIQNPAAKLHKIYSIKEKILSSSVLFIIFFKSLIVRKQKATAPRFLYCTCSQFLLYLAFLNSEVSSSLNVSSSLK